MMLLKGLGAADQIDTAIDGFLAPSSAPTTADIKAFLAVYPSDQRDAVAQRLIARGVNVLDVNAALNPASTWSSSKTWGVISIFSGAASAFHGYRRNQSIGWGLAWFVAGSIFPIVIPTIAIAQGYGVRKES